MRHDLLGTACLVAVCLGGARPAAGQAVPRDRYLDYLPVEVPALVRQTGASARFLVYGDADAPDYVDAAPRDGVDDRRGRLLAELAARFGPIMVLNSTQAPLDFRHLLEQGGSATLNVDTWNLLGSPPTLVRTDTVDLRAVAEDPCPGPGGGAWSASGDCLLQELLRRYDPDAADYPSLLPRAEAPDRRTHEVMFFDFPGDGPETWRREYENAYAKLLPARLLDHLEVYVHPFVREGVDAGGAPGYEFILQYYFFYPTNDGGNNHEGDWEHINVSIVPRQARGRLLTADEVRGILREGAALGEAGGDPLVIRYVDYYFHHQVYRMDYVRPDAYAPPAEWKAQMQQLPAERHGEQEVWKLIRHNAWWDVGEEVVNTHPVCYVGADNKGLDQLLSSPGGKNRDSHGTYPYPGLYKDIGPGGATEQINSALDVKRYWIETGGDLSGAGQLRLARGEAVPYAAPGRITIVPDWERIVPLARAEPAVRRDWSWLILPVHFGYPATESPFAGVVGHADTGNLAPYGPSCQPHWNRAGTEGGSHAYEPHAFATLFPLGLQDTFVNSWGYLNLTLPVVAALPPLDVLWRLGAYPVRLLLQRNDPVYFPATNIPTRFVGLNAGVRHLDYADEASYLLFNGQPGLETLILLAIAEPDGIVATEARVEDPTAWWWQLNFFLGRRFATQNTLLHARSELAIDIVGASGTTHVSSAELNLWEYAGSFRYGLASGNVQPFLKAGYGWTWYRVEGAHLDGVPLGNDQGEWIHLPSFRTLDDMLPNSWHAGAGIELMTVRSVAPFPAGVDVSLVAEVDYTQCSLGLDDWVRVAGSGDLSGGLVDQVTFKRWTWSAGLTLGF